MSKVLITGGTGFIGSHLCEFFVEKGYNVVSFDRYNANYNLGNLENSKYKKDIEFIFGDIRDQDSVEKASKNVDNILHLAALIAIPYSYISPIAYIKTNIEGTYNVLETAKKFNIEQVIVTSTSEVYGSAQYLPMDEKHPLNAQSPYAASKIAADNLADSYHRSYELPVKIIRPFNTFGPRQSNRAVIPTIINQALFEKKIKLGNVYPKRDYVYVKDTVNAYYKVLKSRSFFGQVVNVGSGKNYSIKDIVGKILKITGNKKQIQKEKLRVRKKESEVDSLLANNKFLKSKSNWQLKYSFEQGLKKTIDWYMENQPVTNTKDYIL